MNFDIICFDCDSTLSTIEGIDELAEKVGLGEQMARLTDAAMNGIIPLEAVYARRLQSIQPSKADIDWLAALYISEMVEGVAQTFAALLARGVQVHIISGGLRPAILPLAQQLGIDAACVHAVDIYFHEDGTYRDYEQNSPLARSGGKARVCKQLVSAGKRFAMIGDGKTDMEAAQVGGFTIGFGGVVERDVVRELADVYISNADLRAVLPYLLTS